MRWLFALAVFGAMWLAPGTVRAACVPNPYTAGSFICDRVDEAWAGASSRIGEDFPQYTAYCPADKRPARIVGPASFSSGSGTSNSGNINSGAVQCGTNGGIVSAGSYSYFFNSGCPASSPWKEELHRCFSPEECLQRNATPGLGVETVRAWTSQCIDGCMLEMSNYSCVSTQFGGSTNKVCSGALNYSGTTCTRPEGDPPPPTEPKDPPPKQECTPAGDGQTFCIKPDGQHCYTLSDGRQKCWAAGETGVATDGPVMQKRDAGTQPIAPTLNLPNGDTLVQKNQPVVTTTTTTNNRTTTTVVVNYQTTNGTNAGSGAAPGGGNTTDTGEPADGSGGTSKDGDKDSATDSGNCDTPPACIGDTLKCLQLRYTWKVQCNTSHSEITKGDGCTAGDVPVCVGKSCKAEAYASLLQQWRSRCDAKEQIGKLTNDAANGEADAQADDEAGEVAKLWNRGPAGEEPSFNQGLLNLGGGDVFPTVDLPFGGTWSVGQGFYDALAIIRQIVIGISMVGGFFIAIRRFP